MSMEKSDITASLCTPRNEDVSGTSTVVVNELTPEQFAERVKQMETSIIPEEQPDGQE